MEGKKGKRKKGERKMKKGKKEGRKEDKKRKKIKGGWGVAWVADCQVNTLEKAFFLDTNAMQMQLLGG